MFRSPSSTLLRASGSFACTATETPSARYEEHFDFGGYHITTAGENPHRDAEYRALMADKRLSCKNKIDMVNVIVFHRMPRWLTGIITDTRGRDGMADFLHTIDVLRRIWTEFGGMSTDQLIERVV